jgi:hypothetical protein
LSPRGLGGLLLAYVVLVVAASMAVRGFFMLDTSGPHPVVASAWHGGQLVAREVLASADEQSEAAIRVNRAAAAPGASRVDETVLGTSPLLTWPDLAFSLSFVSGHDGVVATLRALASSTGPLPPFESVGDQVAYVTASDLLERQAYDRGRLAGVNLGVGVDVPVLWALLADRLHTTVPDLRAHAVVRRARFVRSTPGRGPPPSYVTPQALSPQIVRDAMLDAARYVASGIQDDGHFRYRVDARTNTTLPDYDWPRHAGTTYFLAQAAAVSHEPEIAMACLRAAALLRGEAMGTCGGAPCIGTQSRVDLGSTALAVLAFVEIARTGLDPTLGPVVAGMARFLRASQRPDGEFEHEYDRAAARPIDVQYPYYSGEAALALARAHRITADPADLEAARKGLGHLVGPAWSFFGNRYYFGEEHWTCLAMADLWDRAPDPSALGFCVRWQKSARQMQYSAQDSAYDAEGAFGVGPMATPRLTPVASLTEAGVATLEVLRLVGQTEEARALEAQLRRSLALLVRRQLRPGPSELFADPDAVRGAMPSTEVDLELRIDYAQHAGSAMWRWLGLADPGLP